MKQSFLKAINILNKVNTFSNVKGWEVGGAHLSYMLKPCPFHHYFNRKIQRPILKCIHFCGRHCVHLHAYMCTKLANKWPYLHFLVLDLWIFPFVYIFWQTHVCACVFMCAQGLPTNALFSVGSLDFSVGYLTLVLDLWIFPLKKCGLAMVSACQVATWHCRPLMKWTPWNMRKYVSDSNGLLISVSPGSQYFLDLVHHCFEACKNILGTPVKWKLNINCSRVWSWRIGCIKITSFELSSLFCLCYMFSLSELTQFHFSVSSFKNINLSHWCVISCETNVIT